MTHSIATMADTLRNDPGSYGMVTGVGMHMTKHVFGIYSTTPGTLAPPNQKDIQSQLDKKPTNKIVESHNGLATIATYCVVHGRDGEPQHAVLVCDVEEGQRAYAILSDIEACRMGENTELIGRSVQLTPTAIDLPTSKSATRHYAELVD
jgi:acetyl-CoA C-acetyltransferase